MNLCSFCSNAQVECMAVYPIESEWNRIVIMLHIIKAAFVANEISPLHAVSLSKTFKCQKVWRFILLASTKMAHKECFDQRNSAELNKKKNESKFTV